MFHYKLMSLQANAFIDFQVHTICIFFGVHPCTLTKRIETIQELHREHHYQHHFQDHFCLLQ